MSNLTTEDFINIRSTTRALIHQRKYASGFDKCIIDERLRYYNYLLLKFRCSTELSYEDITFIKCVEMFDPSLIVEVDPAHIRHKFCACISENERNENLKYAQDLATHIKTDLFESKIVDDDVLDEQFAELDVVKPNCSAKELPICLTGGEDLLCSDDNADEDCIDDTSFYFDLNTVAQMCNPETFDAEDPSLIEVLNAINAEPENEDVSIYNLEGEAYLFNPAAISNNIVKVTNRKSIQSQIEEDVEKYGHYDHGDVGCCTKTKNVHAVMSEKSNWRVTIMDSNAEKSYRDSFSIEFDSNKVPSYKNFIETVIKESSELGIHDPDLQEYEYIFTWITCRFSQMCDGLKGDPFLLHKSIDSAGLCNLAFNAIPIDPGVLSRCFV